MSTCGTSKAAFCHHPTTRRSWPRCRHGERKHHERNRSGSDNPRYQCAGRRHPAFHCRRHSTNHERDGRARFTAGFIAWLVGSTITKVTNMPVYKWVGDPKNTDPEELRRQRRKLHLGNNLRAWLTFVSVILMACQFGVREVVVVVVLSAITSLPLIWLARKYIPN